MAEKHAKEKPKKKFRIDYGKAARALALLILIVAAGFSYAPAAMRKGTSFDRDLIRQHGDIEAKAPGVRAFSESSRRVSSKDDDCTAGFNVGLDRELWRKGDFGVDLGVGFSYFFGHNFFRASGAAYSLQETGESGDYVTDIAFSPVVVNDPWAQNADGSYGAGTYDGPGPVLDLSGGDITVSHRWANQSSYSRSSSYRLRASGDYEELEMMFAVKPFWEVTDWFRVRGTLGVAVSRTHFTFDVDGPEYSSRQRFDDWAVYGVGGLGGMFSWKGVCLGFDVLARFLDDDIEIRGRDVRGSVERSPWMLTVYVGYAF